eukprot:TRINITY_DN68091_c0_g1_i1.p1 TRINITY_DN68091_c0_g1~~TRINITY_DN68091_c0_g1_i1.p1  ORF type:complete len:180 (-),score=8.59 TRINITY_DN68091_c0_g1_i1:162-623(-)
MVIVKEHNAFKYQPDPMMYGRIINQMSTKSNSHTILPLSRSQRFPKRRPATAAEHLGPGHYRLDSAFPLEDMEQIKPGWLTRSNRALYGSMLQEDRRDEAGALKGAGAYRGGRAPNPVSPGSYNIPRTDSWRNMQPLYSVPRGPARARPTTRQ